MQGIFYGLGNYARPQHKLAKLLYVPTFLVNSNVAALIGLYRFLRQRQTPLWQRVARRDEISDA